MASESLKYSFEKERNLGIDLFRIIGSFLVVLGHFGGGTLCIPIL